MKVEPIVGIWPENLVEQQTSVPGGSCRAVLIARPLAIHIDEVNAAPQVGPSTCHTLKRWPRHIENREHRARHCCRVELLHDRLYRAHGANLIAVNTTYQRDALAWRRTLGDCHRHIPIVSRCCLHSLKIQVMRFSGFEISDVQCTDNLLALDNIAGINGPP